MSFFSSCCNTIWKALRFTTDTKFDDRLQTCLLIYWKITKQCFGVSEFGKIMKYYLYKLFVNDYVQEQEYFPCQYPNLAKDGKENVIVL